MLMIRFQRVGKKNQPSFRVVLTEKHRGPQRKYLEELGFYDPRKKTVQIKSERISYWLSKGAQISPSCRNLLISKGVISGSKIKKGKIAAPSTETKAEINAETAKAEPSSDLSSEVFPPKADPPLAEAKEEISAEKEKEAESELTAEPEKKESEET